VVRPTDAYGDQLSRGPRHGAEDGTGQRALEAYLEYDRGAPPAPPRRRFVDYPRAGRRGLTRWIPSWRVFVSAFLLAVAGLTGTFLVLYSRTELPSQTNADAMFQTTIVYDVNGKEMGRFEAQNRIWTPLNKIPKVMQHAVLSAEDRSFYTNQGISVTSVFRAALNNLRGGAKQGGSTITQQYVKNAYSSVNDRSYTRKLHEFFISLKAARELDKDQILENYLNIIYFGRGCYGVQAASQCYFHKDLSKLTVSQAAYLAGIINGPELYDSGTPYYRAAARTRWNYVLDGMVTEGWLRQTERQAQKFPAIQPKTRATSVKSPFGSQQRYVMDMVQDEAAQLGISAADLQQKGYRIYTTFDPGRVKDAQRSVTNVLGPRKSWPAGTQVAIATLDVKTGAVVSIYGGDGKRAQNAVTQDTAQAGSTFKPFALVAGLEGKRPDGDCTAKAPDDTSLSLRSTFDGSSPQTFDDRYKVSNFSNEQFGTIDLVTATEHSVNTVYVGLNDKVGPRHTMNVAICAGYPSDTQDLRAIQSNVLGTSSPHPIDVAQAFATFAAQGVRHDTFVIRKIVSAESGAVLKQHNVGAGAKQVFDPGVIADATYAMQQVVQHGTATVVSRLNRPVAGKTGTITDNKAAWFAGYTPQYATVVAMYRIGKAPKYQQLTLKPFACGCSQVTGGTLPAELFADDMGRLLQDVPVADFPEPTYGGEDLGPAPTQTQTATQAPTTTTSTQAPSPTPTASPSGKPTPSPTLSPEPTLTSSPSPTRTRPGRPTPRPVPSPTD
jgi:membrane peptidoglycan carboxypeptidase